MLYNALNVHERFYFRFITSFPDNFVKSHILPSAFVMPKFI